MSFSQCELSVPHEDRIVQARHVYEEANKSLRQSNADKEHRLMLLESWRDFEDEHGDDKSKSSVADLMPKRVKKRRKIESDDDQAAGGWEEYFDYIFPEDESARPNLKLLAMAKMWKKQKEVEETNPKNDEEEEDKTSQSEETTKNESENPDADDEDIKNESSSESEEEEEEKDE